MAQWDALVDALARLASRNFLRATRPIAIAPPPAPPETFAGPGPWDRAAVEIKLDRTTLHQWLAEGGEVTGQEEEVDEKLILFSGNDYMGLSSHPAIRKAAVKAAQEYGMGPRGSALICGYTTYQLSQIGGRIFGRVEEKGGLPSLPDRIFCQHGCDDCSGKCELSFVCWEKTCRGSGCSIEKKVVVTDSLFSMDGDFACYLNL